MGRRGRRVPGPPRSGRVRRALGGRGSLAFLVGIGAQFFVPDAKRAQQRSGAAGLMFYRDVFAGIPAYEPSGRELPRMRWK
jgi:hypothetical protein